jgi:hypothetical protein
VPSDLQAAVHRKNSDQSSQDLIFVRTLILSWWESISSCQRSWNSNSRKSFG